MTTCCPTNTQNQPCDEVVDIINLGAGEELSVDFSDTEYGIKSLVAGTGISLTSDPNTVTITSTAVADSCANIGTGDGLYVPATVAPFNFKSLTGGSNILIGSSATEVDIAVTNVITSASSTGTGDFSIIDSGVPPTLQFKELIQGTGITITPVGSDLEISSAGGGISEITSTGTGTSIIQDGVSNPAVLKGLEAGANLTISNLSNSVRFQMADFRQDSFSANKTNIQLIGTTLSTVLFNSTSNPGFNNGAYSTGTGIFVAPTQGMYIVSFNLMYSIPIPEAGTLTASVNVAGAPAYPINVQTNPSLILDSGSIGATRTLSLFAGGQVRVYVICTATATSPQIDPMSTFSVMRVY